MVLRAMGRTRLSRRLPVHGRAARLPPLLGSRVCRVRQGEWGRVAVSPEARGAERLCAEKPLLNERARWPPLRRKKIFAVVALQIHWSIGADSYCHWPKMCSILVDLACSGSGWVRRPPALMKGRRRRAVARAGKWRRLEESGRRCAPRLSPPALFSRLPVFFSKYSGSSIQRDFLLPVCERHYIGSAGPLQAIGMLLP